MLSGYFLTGSPASNQGTTATNRPPGSTEPPNPIISSDSVAATPSSIQTGITQKCHKFYLVKAGDTCDGVITSTGLAKDDFYKWNPAVGSDCKDLEEAVYVCVGM